MRTQHSRHQVTVIIPGPLAELLGPDPATAIREIVLTQLVHERRVTLGYAASLLGLDEIEAALWYTRRGYAYPRLTRTEFEESVDNALRVLRSASNGE